MLSTQDVQTVVAGAIAAAQITSGRSPWYDSTDAAEYIGCTAGTMKTWRARGEGPRYNIINSKLVRYNVSDLDAFVRGEVAR